MKLKQSLLFPVILFCLSGAVRLETAWAIYPWPVSSATAEAAAYITWNTDVAGTSQVSYGTTLSYGNSTSLNSNLVTYHAQTITGLAAGTTYHYQVVSTDGSGNTVYSPDQTFTTLAAPTVNVHTVKTSGGNYSTISACASAAVSGSSAGWTCEVYAGTYNEQVSVSGFTGSSSNQITFIAHDAVLVAAFSIANSSYVNVEGFEVTTTFSGSSFESCGGVTAFLLNTDSYITIASNYAHNMWSGGFVATPYHVTSTYLQVLNNVMAFAGITGISGNEYPCVGTNAGFPGVGGSANYSLFDGNVFMDADHIFTLVGSYNVFRRNIMHDTNPADWNAACASDHVDFFNPYVSNPYDEIHVLIEGNQEYNALVCNMHFSLLEGDSTSTGIVERFNLADNVDSYFMSTGDGTMSGIRIYNNTDVRTTIAAGESSDTVFVTNSPGGTVLNTLFYNAVTDDGSLWWFDGTSSPGTTPGYNLAYNTDSSTSCTWPSSVTTAPGMVLNQNPLFTQLTPYDFRLQASSPARNAGTYLTTVASGDSGSGTSLVVTDAGFFQGGLGIAGVQSDWIQVGSSGTPVQISSVNYSTNTITLANSVSRSSGQGIYLYKDSNGNQVLFGSAPDIGAYPYALAPAPASPTSVAAAAH
jgi:hypothetical protein